MDTARALTPDLDKASGLKCQLDFRPGGDQYKVGVGLIDQNISTLRNPGAHGDLFRVQDRQRLTSQDRSQAIIDICQKMVASLLMLRNEC